MVWWLRLSFDLSRLIFFVSVSKPLILYDHFYSAVWWQACREWFDFVWSFPFCSLMASMSWAVHWTHPSVCGTLRREHVFTPWLVTSPWPLALNSKTTSLCLAMLTRQSKCGTLPPASVCRPYKVCVQACMCVCECECVCRHVCVNVCVCVCVCVDYVILISAWDVWWKHQTFYNWSVNSCQTPWVAWMLNLIHFGRLSTCVMLWILWLIVTSNIKMLTDIIMQNNCEMCRKMIFVLYQ